MLRIRFLNVGDGDAILIEEFTKAGVFRMLVDTGRERVPEPDPAAACEAHLIRLGIRHLDALVITHLHADHVGGLKRVLDCVSVGELVAGYIPLRAGAQIPWDAQAEKVVRGMIFSVNQWARDVDRLRESGCRMTELYASRVGVHLTKRLAADFIVPDVGASRLQRAVWNHMLDGRTVSSEDRAQAGRLRNPNSLRVRLYYAGREIELAGDCYGSEWEDEAQPCDLLKAPHHGDAKSVTEVLAARLKPAHAVISCARGYQAAKDRPSAKAARRLQKNGCQVWYTDAFSDGRQPVRSWPSVDFEIWDDGILAPPGVEAGVSRRAVEES